MFVDDLKIHISFWQEHVNHINMVLAWLKEVNLNLSKCIFAIKKSYF